MIDILAVLESYSDSELVHLVGQSNVRAYEDMFKKTASHEDFKSAVSMLHGYTLVSNSTHRQQFIERIPANMIDEITKKFMRYIYDGNVDTNFDIDYYSALIKISNRFPNEFVAFCGFADQLKAALQSSEAPQGVQNIVPYYPLYDYQITMVTKIQEMIGSSSSSRAMLHLPTGAGKTRTAINVACDHLRNNPSGLVLWLADTTELCAQASNEFKQGWEHLGNRNLKLYSYYSDSDVSLGGIDDGFLVAGLQKVHSSRQSEANRILYQKLRSEVTLVVFDEAHKAIASTYAKTVDDMIGQLGDAFLLGLSATPGRRLSSEDGEDKRLSDFFHSNKVTMKIGGYYNPIEYLVDNGYLAAAEFINIDYSTSQITKSSEATQSITAQVRKELAADSDRNTKLISVIEGEYEQGNSIIVFACSVDHARSLATLLAFRGIKAYSLDSEGDSTDRRRRKIHEYSNGQVKVLINFNILTAGFDAPITSVAIIARPTDSLVQYSQMAGRAMRGRLSKGNDNCRIYTVRDDIPAFRSVANAFSHWDTLWNEV